MPVKADESMFVPPKAAWMAEPCQVPEVTVPSFELAVTAKFVVVAFVEVAFTVTRFVMVEEAEFTRMPSPAVRGERYAPASVQLEEPLPPTQTLFTAKQPSARLMPLAKVEDAVLLVMFRATASMPPPKVEVAEPETVRLVVTRFVVVAFVEVAFTVTRFVMVEEAEFTRSPPDKVASPEAEMVPMFSRLPELSMREVPPVWSAVEAFTVTAVTVPVAVISAPVIFPEKSALPWTAKSADGVSVATPTAEPVS
jgi:hypothetical protein